MCIASEKAYFEGDKINVDENDKFFVLFTVSGTFLVLMYYLHV